MNFKNVLFVICVLHLVLFANAQTKTTAQGIISGRIINEKNDPLPYVNVMISDTSNNFLLGGISEDDGKFNITNIPFGSLILQIKNFGSLPFYMEFTLSESNRKLEFHDIKLEPNLTVLNAIEVVGDKSTMSFKKDKKVFNVGKDILAQSSSALEVLQNVPAVTVGVDGNVSLRGNSNVTVLINGRRSGLSLSNALEQIPAVNIDRVEIITNPSASYDAAGDAGILNIILKKNTDEGINAQLSSRMGIPADYRLTPSITFKKNKLNAFATIGVYYCDFIGTYKLHQASEELGTGGYLSQNENERRHDDGQRFYGGFDYYFNDNTIVTAAYNINKTKDSDKSTITYNYMNGNNLDSLFVRNGKSVENRAYNQLEFNFSKNFKIPEKKVTMDFQYDFWNSTKDWFLQTNREFPVYQNNGKLRTNNKNGNQDFVLQTNYITPLKRKAKIELGLKGEYRNVSNRYLAEHFIYNNWVIFNELENDLSYNEKIGAAYLQYSNEMEKFDYQIGLRHEFTKVEIKDVDNLYSRTVNYDNLFPTANIGYRFSEKTGLQVSYSKRINRPSIWVLNPFNEIKDFTFQEKGNPDLNPAYTNAFELSGNKEFNKVLVNSSVYFHNTQHFFQNYVYRDENNSYVSQPVNLDLENTYGWNASLNSSPVEKVKVYANYSLVYFTQKGTYDKKNFDFTGYFWELQVRTQIKFFKSINFQCFLNYRGKIKNAQTTAKAMYSLNASLNKSFFSNRFTIAFNANNIMDSFKRKLMTVNENYILSQTLSNNAQRFNLSIIYRFTDKQFKERNTKESNRN